jgi:hypothetical protein
MRTGTKAFIAAVAVTFALVGCTSAATESLDTYGQDMSRAQDQVTAGAAPEAGMSGESATPSLDRSVIRTAFISIRVPDVTDATNDIKGLVASKNGLISAEDSQASDDDRFTTLTVQVPASELDEFVADVSKLGPVDSVNVSASDVTTQVVDLDARIAALQTSIERMTELLAQADQIDDLLAIETQLSARQAELDSLTAQRTWIGDQVALSSVTISVSPEGTVTDIDAPGFISGLQNGWAAFVSAAAIGITAIGFLLPFLAIALLIAIPVAGLLVRRSNRRTGKESEDQELVAQP